MIPLETIPTSRLLTQEQKEQKIVSILLEFFFWSAYPAKPQPAQDKVAIVDSYYFDVDYGP